MENAQLSQTEAYIAEARALLTNGFHPHEVIEHFRKSGVEESHLEHVEKKLAVMKSIRTGFTLVLTGALILLTSCGITLISSISNPAFDYVLYGLTSIGASMVIYGMYKVLG